MTVDKHTCLSRELTLPKLLLLLAEVVLFALLAVMASSHYGMADGARITAGFLVAYLIPRVVLMRARATSVTAAIILLLLALLFIYVDFKRLTIWTFFDGYTLQEPNIGGDGRAFYKWALHHYDGRYEDVKVVYPGFPMMMLAMWKVLGLNVVWPLAMNLMFTLTSVVLTGMTTRRLLSGRVSARPETLLWGGMALSALLLYYFVMGTAILKEGPIFISMAMAAYALASMSADDPERHRPWRDIILFVVACLMLGFVRTTCLYFVALGVVVVSLQHLQRDWRMSLAMLAVVAVSLFLGNMFSSYSFDRHAEIAGGGWNMQRFYVVGDSRSFYRELLDYYFLYPAWHKALMLPLTASVQFIIPLPWTYYETSHFINVLSRMTYGWYVVGGISLFYYLFVSWRRGANMGAWAWWAALSYAAIAYITAGSVARYVSPIQPLFVPVAMFVLCRLWEGHWRKAFLWWSVFYVILLATALVLSLEIQQATISKMLHTRSLVHYWQDIPY